jgi:hypothetical protein
MCKWFVNILKKLKILKLKNQKIIKFKKIIFLEKQKNIIGSATRHFLTKF